MGDSFLEMFNAYDGPEWFLTSGAHDCVFGEFKQNPSQLDLSYMPSRLHRVAGTLLLSPTLAHRHTAPWEQMGTAEGQQDNTWWEVLSVCVYVCE